jgi:YD repeat-containing protein
MSTPPGYDVGDDDLAPRDMRGVLVETKKYAASIVEDAAGAAIGDLPARVDDVEDATEAIGDRFDGSGKLKDSAVPSSVETRVPQPFTVDSVNAAGDPLQITEGGVVTTFTYWPSGNVKTETRLGVTLTYADDGQSGTVA